MLNGIWIFMILAAVVCGAATDSLDAVSAGSVEGAKKAVTVAIGLIGIMAFWLGMMRVLQKAGLLRGIARALRPLMTRLFPEVPPDHPAMSMMILNITANMLGLGNAATPFGLKAMIELDTLNQHKGTASNAMALFLAINTSNLALLPTGVIGLRTGLGSEAPGSIILTTILSTATSTLVAIVAALSFQRLRVFAVTGPPAPAAAAGQAARVDGRLDTAEAEALMQREVLGLRSWPARAGWLALAAVAGGAFAWALWSEAGTVGWRKALLAFAEHHLLIVLMVAIILFAIYKKTNVYDAVVDGGKEGFEVAVRIIPYLVAILVAVAMLDAAGAIDLMAETLNPITSRLGIPAESLPMALLRPLTGSGAYGVAGGLMEKYGADSLVGQIVSTMQGSTETTFYVLALYFGVVGIKNTRHTLAACLFADAAGVLAAVWACRLILG